MSCTCSTCGKATSAPAPQAAQGIPFGRHINALALYPKSNQLCSYQRLPGVFGDLFGLDNSQGALMNMFKRNAPIFAARRDDVLAALRRAQFVACDETGMQIEGCKGYQWVPLPRPVRAFVGLAPKTAVAGSTIGAIVLVGYHWSHLDASGRSCTAPRNTSRRSA